MFASFALVACSCFTPSLNGINARHDGRETLLLHRLAQGLHCRGHMRPARGAPRLPPAAFANASWQMEAMT